MERVDLYTNTFCFQVKTKAVNGNFDKDVYVVYVLTPYYKNYNFDSVECELECLKHNINCTTVQIRNWWFNVPVKKNKNFPMLKTQTWLVCLLYTAWFEMTDKEIVLIRGEIDWRFFKLSGLLSSRHKMKFYSDDRYSILYEARVALCYALSNIYNITSNGMYWSRTI